MLKNIIETIFVVVLLVLYFSIWKIKRILQKSATGKDPEIISKSKSNIQIFMNSLFNIFKVYTAVIIIFHSLNIQFYSFFSRFDLLQSFFIKTSGFIIGIAGLSFCFYAQVKMGNSWRVGIDENDKTELITTGLYKYIRNPTYLGIFILNIGIWLIWPTWSVFILNFTFILSLEFQVRCEEDFLESRFGDIYVIYKKKSWRYLPFIY